MKPTNSIRSKIARQTLLVTAAAVILVFAVALSGILFLRSSTIDISEKLGQTAATGSSEALREQTLQTLQIMASDKAALSDGILERVENIVQMTAYNTSLAASRPANAEKTIPFPTPRDAGREMFFLQLPENVPLSDVSEEVSRLSALEDFYSSVYRGNWGITSLYAGTESGASITIEQVIEPVTSIFDPRERPWYQMAKESESGEPVWTGVFDDAFGRGLGIVCVMGFDGANGRFAGAVGAGFILESINEIVLGAKIGETGYSFILNEEGQTIMTSVSHSETPSNLSDDKLTVGEWQGDDRFETLKQKMVSQETGVELITVGGSEYYIAYAPIPTVSWSFATLIGVDEALEAAVQSERSIIELTDEALGNIDFWVLMLTVLSALIVAAVAVVTIIISRYMAKRLTDPIAHLTEGAEIIGGGDMDYQFDIRTGDEIQTLAETFEKMISDIKRVTAEKERIGAELDVATKIQASMLPSIFPAFPNIDEIDLYAIMDPAKEVGGDFYDFFLVDENTLAVVMADVSGKGVPAALFMVIAKTLIKNNAQKASFGGLGKSPAEVFGAVNNILCENNDAGMFVTAFMGYLDIPTGKLTVVNAGHNHPLLKQGENFDWLKVKAGFILAGMENMRYTQTELTMQPGDVLYLYTDGVTEAVNKELELFGDPYLLEIANANIDLSVREFSEKIKNEIESFAAGADQADDITMLTLRYNGNYERTNY